SHQGDPTTMDVARRVDAYAGRMIHRAPWLLLLADVMLGEVALEQGDLIEARRWSARATATVKDYSDAGMLGRRSRSLAAAIEERMYGESVTPAEQRVLDLLPTHLTEKEMAARLYLSTATVKTHRRSIYRKLGVNTRGEAVARARGLGLLPR
ncbi:MAG TPA: LuxR C-terminal-related transcriptional regulator, partial [Thermoleophilia bacterium]|nr:LuxR C-terminal-related transcriptional regulator [Thermoleophilia bacterium]